MPNFRELLDQARQRTRHADPAEAESRLGAAVFLDVREQDEYEQGTIPGSVFIPRGHLESKIENQLTDKGEFAKSWDEAALVFQLAVTETKWEQLVRNARGPFEPFGARHQIMARYTTDPPNAPPGQYVLLQYQTDVSGGRHVVETVTPTFDGKRGWRVSGYYVRLEQ